MGNPFDALSSRFEQVPLIKVNTKNVTIQVPFIYNEDLISYGAKLDAYGKETEKSLQKRE